MDVPRGVAHAPRIVDLYLRALDGSALENTGDSADFGALEAAFVQVAKAFSEWFAISFGAWRDVGVSLDVLRRADIAPSLSPTF